MVVRGRRRARRAARQASERVRLLGRADVGRVVRLTSAAVASYLVATLYVAGHDPLLAPLTALLVVQFTLFSTLLSGIERVVSVISGVLLAVAFAVVVGVT